MRGVGDFKADKTDNQSGQKKSDGTGEGNDSQQGDRGKNKTKNKDKQGEKMG